MANRQEQLMLKPSCDPCQRRQQFRACLLIPAFLGFGIPARAIELDEAWRMLRAGEYDACERAVRAELEANRYGEEWPIILADALTARGRVAEAISVVEDGLRRYKSSVRLHVLAHRLYVDQEQVADARQMLLEISRIGGSTNPATWDADDLVALGRAAIEMGYDPKLVLKQFYDRAKAADAECRSAYLASGRLSLSKADYALASDLFAEGAARFPDDAAFQTGLALAFFPSEREKALGFAEAAIALNPNDSAARLVFAEHLIDAEDYVAAEAVIEEVLDVNPGHADAWAFRAVIAHLENDSAAESRARESGLGGRTRSPRVDFLIGKKLSQKYRFAEGAGYQRRALLADGEYLPAKMQLAQDLLRLGNESEGWELADEVSKKDTYNVSAFNLVNLHESIKRYETLDVGDFVVRMEPREAAVYGDRVVELLRRAKRKLTARYGVELNEPVLVEIFADQRDFAVRTFGMPGGIGYLGVCFGNVITANSPASRASGRSNWEAVLYHEYCHVVTLRMTKNRIPRWLSEGISVYEERRENPVWGQRMNPSYRHKVLEGDMTPIGELSGAFMNAESPQDIAFAYYQSSLVVEFLVDRFGLEAVRKILRDLGAGSKINDALAAHTAAQKQLETDFARFARDRAEALAPQADWDQPDADEDIASLEQLDRRLSERPNNLWALHAKARRLIEAGRQAEAVDPLERAIDLYPDHTGEDSPYLLLAAALRAMGEADRERGVLEKLAQIDGEALTANARLMELDAQRGNWKAVVGHAERFLAVNPMLPKPYEMIVRAAAALHDNDRAIHGYERLLRLDPADPGEVHFQLASLLYAEGRAGARRHALRALEEAPRYRAAHRLLLKIVDGESPTKLSGSLGRADRPQRVKESPP